MNEPTPTGASAVPPSALESLTQQFLNATPLGVANHSYALGATFKVAVSPLLRENEELRAEVDRLGKLHTREGQAAANARSMVDFLRAEVEEYRCANIEARQEIIPDLQQGLTTLNEQIKRKDAELTHLRERVKELEALVESAFTEGYEAGYSNGGDDASAFEHGSSKHYTVKEREKKHAWQESEARAALKGAK